METHERRTGVIAALLGIYLIFLSIFSLSQFVRPFSSFPWAEILWMLNLVFGCVSLTIGAVIIFSLRIHS